MQVTGANPVLHEIVGEVFGHLLRQSRHQDTIATVHSGTNFTHKVVNLAMRRLDDNLRIHQTCRTNDLFDDAVSSFGLVRTGRGGQVDSLADPLGELVEFERTVVHRAGQSETMFYQCPLAAHVPFIHAANLWDGHVGLINDEHKVFWKVVKQTVRGRPGSASVDVPRIVFNASAGTDLLHHLDIVGSTHT